MPITKNVDYLGQAKKRLTEQFKNKPRISGLLVAFMAECQALENATWDVWIDRTLQSGLAFGDLLDKIGTIVGQPREGLIDAQYTVFITARIAANRSDGKRETLIRITRLLIPGSSLVVREYTGAVTIDLLDAVVAPANIIAFDFLIPAAAAGVRLYFIYSGYDSADTFTLSYSGGGAAGVDTQGLGYSGDGTVGGHLTGCFAGQGDP